MNRWSNNIYLLSNVTRTRIYVIICDVIGNSFIPVFKDFFLCF